MTKQRTMALTAAAMTALLVSACGGSETPSPSSSTTAGSASPSGSATSATGDTGSATMTGSETTSATATSTGGGEVMLPDLSGQTIEVAAVWSGAEQENFQKVLDAFAEQTKASVKYTSTGDDIATVLAPRVQGGSAPDVAMLPQPGLLKQFAAEGALKPVSNDVSAQIDANFAPIWKELGTVEGQTYGVWFKAANKSTVWYNVKAFEDAGVQPPTSWDELVTASQTLADSGVTPFSVAGADGWTLTDWFENVYLTQAGPEMYDKLTNHEIPWTDPSVKTALETLAQVWGKDGFVAAGAQQTDFPTSVSNVFADPPKAAMVYEGDFVAGVIASSSSAKVGTDANFFPFPSIGQPAVVGGGDVAVAFKDSPGAQALLMYLATPQAAEIWVEAGGFTSPNKNVDQAKYPDDVSRNIAKALIDAGDAFRFDMSDNTPPAFGGTKGKGMWKDLADFLANPSDADAAMKALEANAAAAYK